MTADPWEGCPGCQRIARYRTLSTSLALLCGWAFRWFGQLAGKLRVLWLEIMFRLGAALLLFFVFELLLKVPTDTENWLRSYHF